jgi:hypothetical protein
MLTAGGGGGGGGFGGGGGGFGGAGGIGATPSCERPLTQWDTFCARPAESTVVRPGLSAAPAGGGRGGPAMTPEVRRVFDIVGISPPVGGRGFFPGGGGGGATTGEYGVVLQIGDVILKQKLSVENVGESGWSSMFSPKVIRE